MDKVDKLLESVPEPEERPFGSYQEEAIVSLALDHPEFFTAVGRFLKPSMFGRLECQWVMAEILNCFEKYEVVPTRQLLRDKVLRNMTEDEPFEDVLEIIARKSNPREVPMIKDTLLQWAKDKAFGLLYGDDAQDAYVRGDYEHLEKIVQDANRIADVGQRGFWFFEQFPILFEPDVIDHRTTGFPSLDRYLNNGGPSPKEVLCWLAATNVGKCHTLQSKIIEKNLSRIFELELEDGSVIKLAGFQRVQTARGLVRVCDLTDGDDITGIPTEENGSNEMPNLWIHDDGSCAYEHNDESSS